MKTVILFETPGGNTVAVICGSEKRADLIREASPWETVGSAPVVSFVEAVAGELR